MREERLVNPHQLLLIMHLINTVWMDQKKLEFFVSLLGPLGFYFHL